MSNHYYLPSAWSRSSAAQQSGGRPQRRTREDAASADAGAETKALIHPLPIKPIVAI